MSEKMPAKSAKAKALREQGYSLAQIADLFSCSTRSVTRWLAFTPEGEEEQTVAVNRSVDKGAELLRKQVEAGELSGDALVKALNCLNRVGVRYERKKLEADKPAIEGIMSWMQGKDGKYRNATGEVWDAEKSGVPTEQGGYGERIIHLLLGSSSKDHYFDGDKVVEETEVDEGSIQNPQALT